MHCCCVHTTHSHLRDSSTLRDALAGPGALAVILTVDAAVGRADVEAVRRPDVRVGVRPAHLSVCAAVAVDAYTVPR